MKKVTILTTDEKGHPTLNEQGRADIDEERLVKKIKKELKAHPIENNMFAFISDIRLRELITDIVSPIIEKQIKETKSYDHVMHHITDLKNEFEKQKG